MVFRNKKSVSRQVQKNKYDSETKLRSYALLSEEELLDHFATGKTGLTSQEAEERLDEYGENTITAGQGNTVIHRLEEAVLTPFNMILLVIAVVTYFTDVVASSKPDYATVLIILCLVGLSSLIAFVQSRRSDIAAEALLNMISNQADAWRDGELTEIPAISSASLPETCCRQMSAF